MKRSSSAGDAGKPIQDADGAAADARKDAESDSGRKTLRAKPAAAAGEAGPAKKPGLRTRFLPSAERRGSGKPSAGNAAAPKGRERDAGRVAKRPVSPDTPRVRRAEGDARPERAGRPEREGRPERNERSQREDRPARAGRQARDQRLEGNLRPDRARQPEGARSAERPERGGRAERNFGTGSDRRTRAGSGAGDARSHGSATGGESVRRPSKPGGDTFGRKSEDDFAKRRTHGERDARTGRPEAGTDEKRPPRQPTPVPPVAARHDGDVEGVRLSKVMAERGMCSRREADAIIERGWVFVDGQRVSELGIRIDPNAEITLAAQAKRQQAEQVTILLHKPVGYVSGQPEPGFEPAVSLIGPDNQFDRKDAPRFHASHLKGLAPAGRLDIDSTGLLVLTQNGRIARQLIGEDSKIEKEYLVRVEGELDEGGLALLNHGLELDGRKLRSAKVEWLNEDQLRFVLREGRKRQIRRMCELVGLKVVGLKRVRIGGVRLGDLPLGQWRFLREDESF